MFPQTIFANQYIEKHGLNKAISKQLEVVSGELFEIRDAASRDNYENAVEEIIDAMQALHTVLYMMPNYSPERVAEIIEQVKFKNEKRGYYVKK